MKKKKITLALQGGGTHLAFSWGVVDALLEDGRFEIEGASGTSAGGLTCAALAQGLLKNGLQGGRDELEAFWKMISERGGQLGLSPSPFDSNYGIDFTTTQILLKFIQVSHLSPYQWNPYGIDLFRKLLEDFFDFNLIKTFKNFKLFLTATNVRNGKLKVFSGNELSTEAFMASSCVPLLSQAVEVDGEKYWDGAYTGNPSLFPLIYNCESKDIVVILVIRQEMKEAPTSYDEIVNRIQELFHTNTLTREMRAIEFITDLIDQGIVDRNKLKKMNIHVIQDNELFSNLASSSRSNTDWTFLNMLFEKGRDLGKNWIKEHYGDVGNRSSTNVKEKYL